MSTAKVGSLAPEFKAQAFIAGQNEAKDVSLKDYQGKWVCLFFYPRDFTFVCPTEIKSFGTHEAQFKELGCQVLGASTDSYYSHKAWFERDLKEVKYPILADTNQSLARNYGVLLEESGAALRGTFLIDPKGVLQWMSVNALDVGRSVDEVVRTLQALKTGSLCPADWKAGQPTLK
jgi:alkyl hydroperoxide reductase subunit AhpC